MFSATKTTFYIVISLALTVVTQTKCPAHESPWPFHELPRSFLHLLPFYNHKYTFFDNRITNLVSPNDQSGYVLGLKYKEFVRNEEARFAPVELAELELDRINSRVTAIEAEFERLLQLHAAQQDQRLFVQEEHQRRVALLLEEHEKIGSTLSELRFPELLSDRILRRRLEVLEPQHEMLLYRLRAHLDLTNSGIEAYKRAEKEQGLSLLREREMGF